MRYFVSVYVEEGKIQDSVKLDGIKGSTEVGVVVKIVATVTKEGKVIQATYNGDKK